MKILVLDQHGDVTSSLCQQLEALEYNVFVADNSIIPLEKWDKEKLQTKYSKIGNIEQLQSGEFDVFIALSSQFYEKLDALSPSKTKGVFFNTQPNVLSDYPNILSCDARNVPEGACLYALTLPMELHRYHGPNANGDYIQLIFDFELIAKELENIQAWHILKLAKSQYEGKRNILSYGDPGHLVRDAEAFPKMFAQLHIKNWGSGNDFAILKGMLRGIPPILYRPFVTGSIIDQFITGEEAFFFDDFTGLSDLLEQIDDEFDLVQTKGLSASRKTSEFMSDPLHLDRLVQFFGSLK